MKKPSNKKHASGIVFAVLGYMTCSACMLLVNKITVRNVPAPSLVLGAQLASTALVVWMSGLCGIIEVDALEMGKLRAFLLVAMIFLATIFTNLMILNYSHVETFIVFRASTPLIISIFDWVFLGRELPSKRSWLCLSGLLLGAFIYVKWDDSFHPKGYMWIALWYTVFTVDQIYIKHVCNKVKMKSNWGFVFYSNFIPSFPLFFMSIAGQEATAVEWTQFGMAILLVSCFLGIAMSYFAFLARSSVSATYFTIIGNVCKILTVIMNQLIWDLHANFIGVCALLFCLACAYFYRQAPMRKELSTAGNKE